MGSVGWWVLVIVAGLIAAALLVAVWRLVAGPRRESRGL
jgi:multisubunit Na+/H+ antiporter MnhF subunit